MDLLDQEALELGLAALAPPPTDRGRVALVVLRPSPLERALPPSVTLTREEGVRGDRWTPAEDPDAECQVTVMRADVAHLFARDGDIARFGDNLFVDLDLSEANLPAGSVLAIGGARCVVTAKPHLGCAKFALRAGDAALRFTVQEASRALRLRGVHLRVLVPGEVRPGDAIVVVERP
jgi:MOSC domain-containing protein YiiM